MALTEYGKKQDKILADLEWENMQLKNAIIKHFLGIDLENKPSNRIIDTGYDDCTIIGNIHNNKEAEQE